LPYFVRHGTLPRTLPANQAQQVRVPAERLNDPLLNSARLVDLGEKLVVAYRQRSLKIIRLVIGGREVATVP
jgi:hypothetical protein